MILFLPFSHIFLFFILGTGLHVSQTDNCFIVTANCVLSSQLWNFQRYINRLRNEIQTTFVSKKGTGSKPIFTYLIQVINRYLL